MAAHLIILSQGHADGGEKATLAFGLAMSALACGDEATVYLTMGGVCWAYRPCSVGSCVKEQEPVCEFIEQFLELGGRLLLCSRCVEDGCGRSQTCPTDQDLFPGVEFVGLATITELAPSCAVYTF
jgi:predicted peroxiredoxin